jgi:hypothetical protein
MSNLDLGVKRALVATLVAAGVNPATAAARVTDAKVALGVSYIKTRFDEAQRLSASLGDDETSWSQAFQDLKTWAAANV